MVPEVSNSYLITEPTSRTHARAPASPRTPGFRLPGSPGLAASRSPPRAECLLQLSGFLLSTACYFFLFFSYFIFAVQTSVFFLASYFVRSFLGFKNKQHLGILPVELFLLQNIFFKKSWINKPFKVSNDVFLQSALSWINYTK